MISTTIEIDCSPEHGFGNQERFYNAVCKLAGLAPQNRTSAFFGCWTWPVEYENKEQQNVVGSYLKDLYHKGLVRYASW